jgi:hypothetical protein
MTWLRNWAVCSVAFGTLACGNSTAQHGNSNAADPAIDDATLFQAASRIELPLLEAGRSYLALATPSLVTPISADTNSSDWDLAFEGYDVFTNSGASGSGKGGAFGPLSLDSFLKDTAPEVPFISVDKAGGAFLDWYAYDGDSHALYSRYHVYGVQRGEQLWKVQILSYYGEQDNAPVSALYSVRYAELGAALSEAQTIEVDGTAGGIGAPADAATGCLDLASGTVTRLTLGDAHASSAWDLCFRRDAVSVNGQPGGLRGDAAVDLQASETASEQLATLMKETAASQQARFDDTSAESFAGARFRGDHVVSAFESGRWLDESTSPPAPARAAWLVTDASGELDSLIAFDSFINPTTTSAGAVVLYIKPVRK